MDKIAEAAEHYKRFCETLGIDISRPDTLDTPLRYARMMHNDFMVGTREPEFNFTTFPCEGSDQLVTEVGIRIVSICSHHHMPMFGTLHVCYLPNEILAGYSKIPRLVKHIALQPSMQEHIINEIVNQLAQRLKPRFLGVSMIAEHTCMSCRGVNEPSALAWNRKFWVPGDEMGKEGRPLDVEDFAGTKQEFQHAINEYYHAKGLSR